MAEESFYFIKMTAKEPSSRTYVLLCIVVPENKSGVDRMDLVVSQNPETVAIGPSDSYRDCRNKIQKITLSGAVLQSATQGLSSYLKESFGMESYMIEFFHYLEHFEEEKLKSLLMQSVHRVMGKGEQDSILYLSKVTKSELEAVSNSNKQEEQTKQEEVIPIPASVPKDAKLVNFQFILSPVTGTSVSELRKEDLVMIKILPDSDETKTLIETMKLKDEAGVIHPCPATIIDFIRHERAVEIIVKIDENVYGRCIEDEMNIRVKMYETPSQLQEEQVIYDSLESNEKSWFVPAVITIAILTVLWIIVTFFVL